MHKETYTTGLFISQFFHIQNKFDCRMRNKLINYYIQALNFFKGNQQLLFLTKKQENQLFE